MRLSANEVEICDDGVGGNASFGNGLGGLHERVTAAGGTLDAGPIFPRGWRLRSGRYCEPRVGMTIRLLLADDQELVRSALCALLDLEEDFEVVAAVGRGDEVTSATKAHHPDVALLDIEMPGLDGLAAAAVLTEQVPACRVVILTTFGRAGYLRRAMEAGAVGFVVKDAPAEALAAAIRRVMAGSASSTPSSRLRPWQRASPPLPLVNATCSAWPARGQPWPRSLPGCTSQRAPSGTTSRQPSPRPRRGTDWTLFELPTSGWI